MTKTDVLDDMEEDEEPGTRSNRATIPRRQERYAREYQKLTKSHKDPSESPDRGKEHERRASISPEQARMNTRVREERERMGRRSRRFIV